MPWYNVPFVARGHGSGLSGGALPIPGGVVIGLARLNRVLDVDIPNRRVTVEPGVTNLEITRQVAPFGFYYAPDPSSQQVCSIGGNVAENSGGAHCLKYGFTVHHVLSIEAVLANGDLVQLDSAIADAPGPDLLGVLIGSEGTLAVVTKVTVRILRRPESVQTLLAAYDSISAAGTAVSEIIAAGIIPAAVEIMDGVSLIAVEAAVHPNFPPAEAILIVELDGPVAEVREQFAEVEAICHRAGATTVEVAQTEEHRARIWKGRKGAFASMGRVTPNYYVQDGVVPRTKLPEVLDRIRQLEARCGLRIGNVFHAGDGNLHPLICYDEKIPGQSDLAAEVGAEILQVLHRRRRIAHRRTRDRRRQGRIHAEDVLGGRPRRHADRAPRVRSEGTVQPGQGVSDAAALWRSSRTVSRTPNREGRVRRTFLGVRIQMKLWERLPARRRSCGRDNGASAASFERRLQQWS